MEHPDIDPARIRFQNIVSNLNTYAASDQEQPYLHAVMFLQRVLSEKYGGELTDYCPKLTSTEPHLMDGTEGFLFRAQRKDDLDFTGSYAVRKTEEPHDCRCTRRGSRKTDCRFAHHDLLLGVQSLTEPLKVELMDILYNIIGGIPKSDLSTPWKLDLRTKFARDRWFFQTLTNSKSEDFAAFAELILDQL